MDRPAGVLKTIGKLPEKWAHYTHDNDGHGVDSLPEYRRGENIFINEVCSLYVQHGIEEATDDVSGAYLDPALVKAGRILEMNYFKEMKVYERLPGTHLATTAGKLIGAMWTDTNKGDSEKPNVRCRLVGKEFRTGPDDAPSRALRLWRR